MEYREARYPSVWFGDGHWAELRKKLEYKNEDGIWGWLMIINPSREIISEYNLDQKEDMDDYGFVRRWYPKSSVKILRDDPVTGRVLVKTDFNGNDTALNREVVEYIEMINDQQKIIKVLKAGKARLTKELEDALSQSEKYWTKHASIIESIKKKTGSDDDDGFGDEMPGAGGM